MPEDTYRPRSCAFHPKELIFNFCKHPDCLLPMCPTCVKVHSEEHKDSKSYGKFEHIGKVVSDLEQFYAQTTKELHFCSQDIKEHAVARLAEQDKMRSRIRDARQRMVTLVERFFADFEKEVDKSLLAFNDNVGESYKRLEEQIEELRAEMAEKTASLPTEKVLKTVIGFYQKGEEQKVLGRIEEFQERLATLLEQKVEVVCEPAFLQKVVDELGNYINITFHNWQSDIKYNNDFVKTGFDSDFESKTARVAS